MGRGEETNCPEMILLLLYVADKRIQPKLCGVLACSVLFVRSDVWGSCL